MRLLILIRYSLLAVGLRRFGPRVIDLPTTMLELPKGQEWVFEMINNILIEVLASIAEQERLTIRGTSAGFLP